MRSVHVSVYMEALDSLFKQNHSKQRFLGQENAVFC